MSSSPRTSSPSNVGLGRTQLGGIGNTVKMSHEGWNVGLFAWIFCRITSASCANRSRIPSLFSMQMVVAFFLKYRLGIFEHSEHFFFEYFVVDVSAMGTRFAQPLQHFVHPPDVIQWTGQLVMTKVTRAIRPSLVACRTRPTPG